MLTYPGILDFKKEEKINIRFLMLNPSLGKNIKLNYDSPDLDCVDLINMKKCIVPKSHFDNEESGYYNIYHLNHLGGFSIYINANPFKVILPDIVKKKN